MKNRNKEATKAEQRRARPHHQPPRQWPVKTSIHDRENGRVTVLESQPDTSHFPTEPAPSLESMQSFSGVHSAATSGPALTGMGHAPLWELAAMGENLSRDLPAAPHSPLPASHATFPHAPETSDLVSHNELYAEPSALLAGASPHDTLPTPAPGGFLTDGSFAHRARPTLQLTPPTYEQPRPSRCPSLHLWFHMTQTLLTPIPQAKLPTQEKAPKPPKTQRHK